MDYTEFKEEIDHDLNTQTMGKAYTFYEQTIIDNIDFSEYEDDADIYGDYPLYTDIQNLYFMFKKEHVHENNKDISERILFRDWLQGLPSVLTVPSMNYDILNNAEKANVGPALSAVNSRREQQEDEFIDRYWYRLADAFFTLKENL